MLHLEQMINVATHQPLRGFVVRNKTGKVMAMGATGSFVIMNARRYERDRDMVAKVERLTSLTVRLSARAKGEK